MPNHAVSKRESFPSFIAGRRSRLSPSRGVFRTFATAAVILSARHWAGFGTLFSGYYRAADHYPGSGTAFTADEFRGRDQSAIPFSRNADRLERNQGAEMRVDAKYHGNAGGSAR